MADNMFQLMTDPNSGVFGFYGKSLSLLVISDNGWHPRWPKTWQLVKDGHLRFSPEFWVWVTCSQNFRWKSDFKLRCAINKYQYLAFWCCFAAQIRTLCSVYVIRVRVYLPVCVANSFLPVHVQSTWRYHQMTLSHPPNLTRFKNKIGKVYCVG